MQDSSSGSSGAEQAGGEHKHFGMIAGDPALDLVNTVGGWTGYSYAEEHLTRYEDLLDWGVEAGVLTSDDAAALRREAALRPAEAEAVVARARSLRRAIRDIFIAAAHRERPGDKEITLLNGFLGEAMARLRLAAGEDGIGWRWDRAGGELDQPLWPVARSAAELLTSERLERVRACSGDTCGWMFLDMSRNRSRRWCDMNDCGNRAKARRHYAKRRGDGAG